MRLIDLSGKKFNRLLVIKLISSPGDKYRTWQCVCDCGKQVEVIYQNLVRGNTRSCGCLQDENRRKQCKSKHPFWKGDDVGYRALHQRMYKEVKKPDMCEICKNNPTKELANKSHEYKTTPDDWMWLCKECHARYDKNWFFKDNKWFKQCKDCGRLLEVNENNFYRRTSGKWVAICKICSNLDAVKKSYKRKSNRIKNRLCTYCGCKLEDGFKYKACDNCRKIKSSNLRESRRRKRDALLRSL